MQPPLQPFTEPWRTTALRTGSLALAVGVGVGLIEGHLAVVPSVTLVALWFTLGGHFLELLFRNRLRQHISGRPAMQVVARVAYWFVGGAVLFEGALATRALVAGRMTVPLSWWLAGIAFVGVELLIHLGLRVRGQPSVYDGRG
jgi:hypothetical protein